MITIPKNILNVLVKINSEMFPVSIFIYGSRSRNDFVTKSDYEIGIIYLKKIKISRSELVKMNSIKNLRLYPFCYDDFINYNLDTPFPKIIYIRGLVESAKTLYGKEIVENIKIPQISLIDLLEEAVFQISRAYTAMLSQRQGDLINANEGFTKSTLFATRVLIILKMKMFPLGYEDIVKLSKNLNLDDEYKLVINHTFEVRNGKRLEIPMLFKNISFINQVVIFEIKNELKHGNKIII